MSWADNEKLNEWIERAYENGKREEQERIIELIQKDIDECPDCDFCIIAKDVIALIKGETND